MVQPARVVVVIVGEDDGGNVLGRIKSQLTQPRANLLMGSNPDADLLGEKRIPPRQISRRGVLRAITGIYNETAFGMFDHPGENFQRAHPMFVAEDVDLALTFKRLLGLKSVSANHLSCIHDESATGRLDPSEEVRQRFPGDEARLRRMSLVEEEPHRQVRMAYLAALGSFKINGVAADD